MDPLEFRRILAHWSTGVAVIATVTRAGVPAGLTATAICSVSLKPPLVLACVERGADSHDALLDAGCFSINILASDGEAIARTFAGDSSRKFDGIDYRTATSGAPVLVAALAWVDCRVHAVHDGGDHSIFIGAVLSGSARDGEPLLYNCGRYTGLMP